MDIQLSQLKLDDIANLPKNIQKLWMEENYMLFNTLFFNNDLPDLDEIIMTPIKRKNIIFLGCAYNKYPFVIKLNFRYHIVEIEWQNVLLHEMIHIWQYVNGYKGGHGSSFKNKAKEINNYGWGITTCYKNILIDLNEFDEFKDQKDY